MIPGFQFEGLSDMLVEAAGDWQQQHRRGAGVTATLEAAAALRRQGDAHASRLFAGFVASCVEQGWRMEQTQLDVGGHRGDW